jgi:hypothetical protein
VSAVVSVFDEWGRRFGDRGQGLLMALGIRAAEGAADNAWRVGVLAQEEAGGAGGGARVATNAVRRSGGKLGRGHITVCN